MNAWHPNNSDDWLISIHIHHLFELYIFYRNKVSKGCVSLAEKKYYYVTGNTAEGFVNFLESNVVGFNKVVVLKHMSNKVKTLVLEEIIRRYEQNHDLEIICSALSRVYLDGIIIRDKGLAIITETIAPSRLQHVQSIDLESIIQNENPIHSLDKHKVAQLKVQYDQELDKAYQSFATGLTVHDDLEAIYINEMDFNKADQVAEEFINNLLEGVSKKERKSKIYYRLFGTSTAEGPITVVPQIINNLSKRVFVKGRAGTGKSVFMKKVAQACKNQGLDFEIHRCSFDPNSVDMVHVPELSFVMMDSTDPHEFFPERKEDVVIDLYEKTVTAGTDEKYAKRINKVNSEYKSYMKKGVVHIKEAAKIHEALDREFIKHEGKKGIQKAVSDILNS